MPRYRVTWIEAPVTGRGFDIPSLKRYEFSAESGNKAMWKALCFVYNTTPEAAERKMKDYNWPDVKDYFMHESATRKVINVELKFSSNSWYEIWHNDEMIIF